MDTIIWPFNAGSIVLQDYDLGLCKRKLENLVHDIFLGINLDHLRLRIIGRGKMSVLCYYTIIIHHFVVVKLLFLLKAVTDTKINLIEPCNDKSRILKLRNACETRSAMYL